MDSATSNKFARVAHKIDPHSHLLRAWALHGGVSAQVTALEIVRADGQRQKLVVRQHGAGDLRSNPNIASDEFRLLSVLRAQGLPVPTPYAVDATAEIFDTPYLVVEYVDGTTEFAPDDLRSHLKQMARYLAQIHRLKQVQSELSFLPKEAAHTAALLRERPSQLDDSLNEGRIRDALDAAEALPERNPVVLLHGDYWSGNLLWQAGELAAIIDWEDAKLGDPLADLSNARLEVQWAFGIEAMRQFTHDYRAMTTFDFSDLPYRDLIAALKPAFKLSEWAVDQTAEQQMRERHHLFVEQAFAKLASR